jgi:ATP-binding cassette subfamily B protein
LPAILGLNLLSIPLALLAPVPLAVVVDSVIGSKPLPGFIAAIAPGSIERSPGALLGFSVVLLVAIALLLQVQDVTRSLLSAYTGERMQLDLRARLFDHAQRLSLTYHDSVGTADSTYRIQYDATAVESIAIGTLTGLATSTLTVGMMTYVTFRLDWQLGLVAIGIAPFLYTLSHLYRRRYRGRYREVKRLESSALAVVQEVLTSVRVVKAFGQEDREHDRFVRRSRDGMKARLRLAVAEQGLGAMTTLITSGGTAVVLYIGVRHVQSGALSLGHLLLIMTYIAQLYSPLKTISKRINSLQGSLASAERAFELLDRAHDVEEAAHPRAIARVAGHIELKDVVFGYDDTPVLKGISLRIPRGTRVGIVGRTGAGKSTLASLLPRFYEPTSGHILLDGVDLRDFALKNLRDQFAIVLQDTILFSTTIAENIGYGRPRATFEEIVAAAKAANADSFIRTLPDGYDTLVGERGMRLSGGERQRIALARAFLKDAPILILDEPTSSVDVATEAGIMEAIDRLMAGRTTVMIAHRLGTLDICDVRLVMDEGRIVEARTRAETPNLPATLPVASESPKTPSPHPAAVAWRTLRPPRPAPDKVDVVKERRFGKRTAVYRLHGAGPDGSAIVAKRSPRRISHVEKMVHEQLLPNSGLPGFSFHGFVEEQEGSDCWLFTSDLEGARYMPRQPEHQALAGRWLGLLHSGTADLARRVPLPDRGTGYLFEQLRQVIVTVGTALDATLTRPADRASLVELAAHLRVVERCAPEIEDLCGTVPDVLVHGDFGRKNLRIRRGESGPQLLVFDWEMSGWGKPLVDLARSPFRLRTLGASPDLISYHRAVSERLPELTSPTIRRLSEFGSMFRAVLAISWATAHLDHEWNDSMADLRFYSNVLRQLTRGSASSIEWTKAGA